jgi:ATP-binding cassette, subfamily B, bacterial PglK
MVETLRSCLVILGPGQRARWVLVIALALLASAFEIGGALIVLALLARITTDTSGFDVPLLGDLRQLAPGTDEHLLMALIGGGAALFFLVRGVVIVAQSYVQYRVAENAGARLAGRLLETYLALPYEVHLRRSSGELIRNSYEVAQSFVREALLPAVKLVGHSVLMLGLLGVLLYTAPWATFFVLAALIPITWVLLRVIHPRVKLLGVEAQQSARSSLQTLEESLAGWRDIKILGRERFFVDRFAEERRRVARTRYLRGTASQLPRIVMETSLVLLILAFLGVTVLIEGGALDALPTLGLFGYVAVRMQPSLNEIMTSLNALKFVAPGIELLEADLRLPRAVSDGPPPEPLPLRRELRLERVSVRYGGTDQEALRDVDVTIRRGEFIGIVGPTGGGKSTLVDVMLGLLEPTSGRVLVDGVDIRGLTAAWQASLGAVHQTIFLADETLRTNIALGVPPDEIDDELVREAARLAQLESFVASLPDGLDTVVGQRGARLSGGQRQRLAIARALYRRPSVLVLDEGTSALDSATEAELIAALEPLRGERTVIAVAHRLTTLATCDRVLLVDDGRVVDSAPMDELVSRHGPLLAVAR